MSSSPTSDTFFKGIDTQATTFICHEIVIVSVGQPEQVVSSFVLDSKHFKNLQIYVDAGVRLPQSEAAFNTTFPQKLIEEHLCLKKDKSQYASLRTTLLSIAEHCTGFETKTMSRLIDIGGSISNYAERAETNFKEIADQLEIITRPGSKISDEAVKVAIDAVMRLLKPLIRLSKQREEECKELGGALADFKTKTMNDESQLKPATDWITANAPQSKIKATLAEKRKCEANAKKDYEDTVDAHRQKLREKGERRWYYSVPLVGVVLDSADQRRNSKILKEMGEGYQRESDRYGQDVVNLESAYEYFMELASTLESIQTTIGAAITAVGMMQTAFSDMTSNFDRLTDALSTIGEDANESNVKDRLITKDELYRASDTWADIYVIAKEFQYHGRS